MLPLYVPGPRAEASAYRLKVTVWLPMSAPRETPWKRDNLSHGTDGERRQTRGPVPALETPIETGSPTVPSSTRRKTFVVDRESAGTPKAWARSPLLTVGSPLAGLGVGMSMAAQLKPSRQALQLSRLRGPPGPIKAGSDRLGKVTGSGSHRRMPSRTGGLAMQPQNSSRGGLL